MIHRLKKAYFIITRFLAMRGIRAPFQRDSCGNEYWRSRNAGGIHGPENYTKADNSTRVMFEDIIKTVPKDASFLEIGCNAGRNLNFLHGRGFRELAGMEINAPSVHEVLKETFPKLYHAGKFYVGDAADEIKKISDGKYDVVFSIAVLEHIPPKDRGLFRDMVRVSKKYVAVITGERKRYDFERVFEDLDCTMIQYRLFYGENHDFSLPRERYDEKKHFFNSMFLRIFIKNDRP